VELSAVSGSSVSDGTLSLPLSNKRNDEDDVKFPPLYCLDIYSNPHQPELEAMSKNIVCNCSIVSRCFLGT
jgi:hypothetical protein